jgi:hypothetical protein
MVDSRATVLVHKCLAFVELRTRRVGEGIAGKARKRHQNEDITAVKTAR